MPLNPDQQLTATLTDTRFKATFADGVPGPPGPQGIPGIPSEVRDEGVALPARQSLNFVGAGVTATDDATGGRTVITIPGASQTPWLQDVDAANFDLNNVGIIRFASTTLPGPIADIGNEEGTLHLLTDNGGSIDIESVGTGRVMISTDATRRIVVRQDGNVGIGPNMNPSWKLDVQGDVNTTGVYRVNGVPLETGGGGSQTPWLQNVDAAGFSLNNLTAANHSGTDNFYIRAFDAARMLFQTDSVSRMWIEATGEIIIPGALECRSQIHSTSGGFRFPDGTVQTTAATGGGAAQTPWAQDVDAAGFKLNSAGAVGIGIAAPPSGLQLHGADGAPATSGAAQTYGVARISRAGSADVLDIGSYASPGGVWMQGTNAADLSLTAPLTLQPNGGNVGFGTGAPQGKIDCRGRAYFYAVSENLGIYLGYNTSTAGFWLGGTTNNDLAFTTQGGTERMRLTDLGQLGIRTATPFSRISMGTSNQNANSRVAFYESATGTTCRAIGMANPTGAVYGVAIWANTGGVVPSETNMHVFIADGGNVGIGTSAPFNRLTVADTSRTYSDIGVGSAALTISSQAGAQLDDNLLFGVHTGDYAWLQACKPGTANRILMLNPAGGAIIQSVAWQDTTLMPNMTMSVFYDEANNRLAFVARGAGGVVKSGFVNVT